MIGSADFRQTILESIDYSIGNLFGSQLARQRYLMQLMPTMTIYAEVRKSWPRPPSPLVQPLQTSGGDVTKLDSTATSHLDRASSNSTRNSIISADVFGVVDICRTSGLGKKET